jgi:GT2 family glycosyltransferase
VIGNYEGEHLLEDCIGSLRAQSQPPSEIVVVDASSRDRSVEVAERLGTRTLVVPNLGLSVSYNAGVAATSAEHVLLSNNDVAYAESCLELLSAALDEDRDRFAADPCQVDWDDGAVIHAATTFTRGPLLREHLPGLHLDHLVPAEKTVPTVNANGAAMLVRRAQFEALGGFDETFFMEWEDLDLCWRAWLRGWPTVYVPAAVVRHRVGAVTTGALLPKRLTSSHHNRLRFVLKCFPARPAATVVAGELLRTVLHPRLTLPAFASIARELPEIMRLRRALAPDAGVFAKLVGGARP